MPTRVLVLGGAFVALVAFIVAVVALSSGGSDEQGSAEDTARNTSGRDTARNTTDEDTAPNATNRAAAATRMGRNIQEALSDMTVQPNDLPAGFVLQEERFYTREELFQEIPTTTQAAEEGLKYALHRSFVKEHDKYPEKVDVFAYVYTDAQAATTAHQDLLGEGAGAIMTRLTDGEALHDYTAMYSGGTDGLGEGSVSYDVNINTQTATPIHALVFGMRHANVRAEVAAIMRANPYLLPDDVARSQLLRIEQGSLTSTVD